MGLFSGGGGFLKGYGNFLRAAYTIPLDLGGSVMRGVQGGNIMPSWKQAGMGAASGATALAGLPLGGGGAVASTGGGLPGMGDVGMMQGLFSGHQAALGEAPSAVSSSMGPSVSSFGFGKGADALDYARMANQGFEMGDDVMGPPEPQGGSIPQGQGETAPPTTGSAFQRPVDSWSIHPATNTSAESRLLGGPSTDQKQAASKSAYFGKMADIGSQAIQAGAAVMAAKDAIPEASGSGAAGAAAKDMQKAAQKAAEKSQNRQIGAQFAGQAPQQAAANFAHVRDIFAQGGSYSPQVRDILRRMMPDYRMGG